MVNDLHPGDELDFRVSYFFDYLSIEGLNLHNKKKDKMLVNLLYFFKGDLGVDLFTLERNSDEFSLIS
jgi:hypothetical protein